MKKNNIMQGFSNALINMMALFSAIILNSCVSAQYNINQNIPPKEACAFVLDTIHINNPVIIEYNNIRYVVDTPNVDSIPQKDIYAYLDSTFHYLLGDNIFYDLPNFLYDKVIKFYNDEVCEYVIDSNRKSKFLQKQRTGLTSQPQVWRFFYGMRSTVDGGDVGRMQVMSKIIILASKRIKNDRMRKDARR